MRAPLADVSELLDLEAVFFDRIQRRYGLLVETLPVRRLGAKTVSEIDESVRREGRISLIESRCRGRFGKRQRRTENHRRQRDCGGSYAIHFNLLDPLETVVDLSADGPRLIGCVADQLRNIELELGIVRGHQRRLVGQVVDE